MKAHIDEGVDEMEHSTGSEIRFGDDQKNKSKQQPLLDQGNNDEGGVKPGWVLFMLIFIKDTSPNLQVCHPSRGHD